MIPTVPTVKEILQKVDELIKSNKYHQITRRLSNGNCGRCYLGLVCQVLVDEGYYTWGNHWLTEANYILKPTEKGITAGFDRHSSGRYTPLLDFPRVVNDTAVWELNDVSKLKFEDIHNLVVDEIEKSIVTC
jgi:hypothetical protein